MKRLALALTLAATPAAAQESAAPVDEAPTFPVESIAVQELPPGSVKGRVVAEYAEARAGPGAAYVSRGRVYQGDLVDVRRRNEAGTWVEVVGGGVRGWVRVGELALSRPDAPIEAGDAGRDRRETNYAYDEQGRRRWPDGGPMGSGEGTAGAANTEVEAPKSAERSAFSLRAGLAATRLSRSFVSNVERPSALRTLEAAPVTFGAELGADWDAQAHFAMRAALRATTFGDTTIPANGELGLPGGVTVAADALAAELDAVGRYPLGDGWAGLYAGGRYARQAYQETKPFPLLLTTSVAGLGGGAAGAWTFGELAVDVRAGVLLPLSVAQSPTDSGGFDGGAGWEAGAGAAWTLSPAFAVFAALHHAQWTLDFAGESGHADTATADAPKTYTRAREEDASTTFAAGLRWTP